VPRFEAHFTPCVEIGWRLDASAWGHGYASEAARAGLAFGFEERELPEIVSFTAAINRRSRQVMERIAMRRRAQDDFSHPALPPSHRLRDHVLYRLTRVEWIARRELARNPARFA
jgi:RimJ/RimL family protein N-acetyltransferase